MLPVTPPFDPPRPVVTTLDVPPSRERKRQPSSDSSPPPRTKRPVRADDDDEEDDSYYSQSRRKSVNSNKGGDWVTNEVSSWFRNGSDFSDESNTRSSPKGRRRRRSDDEYTSRRGNIDDDDEDGVNEQNMDLWKPITNAFDAFLGINRDNLRQKAAQYNSQVRLQPSPPIRVRDSKDNRRFESNERDYRRRRQHSSRPKPIRPGFSYRYNKDEDENEYDDDGNVIDTEPIAVEDDIRTSSSQSTPTKPIESDQIGTTKRGMTREERALAIERVPPANVPAWGPTGDLCMDARTKALSDALEDIASAKETIVQRAKKVNQIKEEMTILRVDAELERKRLRLAEEQAERIDDNDDDQYEQNEEKRSRIKERLRHIDRTIEETSRTLRFEQFRLDIARSELDEIENRHWALLRLYDPNLAQEAVDDALRELEDKEAAIRSIRERKNDTKSNAN